MMRAAREQPVIYWEEPIYHDSGTPRLASVARGDVTVITPLLPVALSGDAAMAAQRTLLTRMLERLDGYAQTQRTFWYYTPMALAFSGGLRSDVCVYDCMDELSAFHGAADGIGVYEDLLFERADVVFTGGRSLFEAKRSRHPQVRLFPSSIDYGHFVRARSRNITEPSDQQSIPHPRIGFFGVIDERMDIEFLARTAALRPDWQFVMIGPTAKIDEAALPQASNIHWLGNKAYAELPTYLASWDLGIMPFARNGATKFISPTKTPEFLAAGLPVVSTAIRDVVHPYGESGLVRIANTPEDAVAMAAQLLEGDRDGWLADVDGFLDGMSWDRTWAGMSACLDAERARALPVGAPAGAPALSSVGSHSGYPAGAALAEK